MFSVELKKTAASLSRDKGMSVFKSYTYFEIYYFNDKLNFYEPLVELTTMHVNVMTDTLNNTHVDLELNHTLNINFSVALCSTVSTFLTTLEEERDFYKSQKGDNKTASSGKKYRREIDFNPSLFWIKNNTGEVLWFKT